MEIDLSTLIAAAIGFLGVIITLLFNGWLNRKARQDEIDHQRTVLVTALVAELEILKESLINNIEDLDTCIKEGNATYVPSRNWSMVFEHSIKDLGLLSEESARKIVDAYMGFDTYFQKLPFLIGDLQGAKDQDYILIPADHVSVLKGMTEGLIEPIDQALLSLKGLSLG